MGSSILARPAAGSGDHEGTRTRLAVTWQHPHSRRHEAVGMLSCDDHGFHFRYLRRAEGVQGFQPFLGFEELGRTYSSPRLFPLFTQRIMRASRPDFPKFLESLRLTDEANDWQILARSQGQREGDGIRVLMEPGVDVSGNTNAIFLVHGVRHRLNDDPGVDTVLSMLKHGDQLKLVNEPLNPVDSLAILVSNDGGTTLGWVPSVLLPYVHRAQESGALQVTVLQSSGPTVPPGYRLLVEVSGRVLPGYRPFDGPDWAPYTD